MIDNVLNNTKEKSLENKKQVMEDYDKRKYERAARFLDMQNVISQKLAQGQASVDNAENYPSTWTTNPDGGANGPV